MWPNSSHWYNLWHIIQKVDATCDTNDLVQLGDTYIVIDDFLTSHGNESIINSKLMNTCFVDELQ